MYVSHYLPVVILNTAYRQLSKFDRSSAYTVGVDSSWLVLVM